MIKLLFFLREKEKPKITRSVTSRKKTKMQPSFFPQPFFEKIFLQKIHLFLTNN